MTPKSRSHSRSTADHSHENFHLTSRVSEDRNGDDHFIEEINPDSDAAFLRRHRSIDGDSSGSEDHVAKPGLLRRIFKFMSRSPLLRRSSSIKDAAYAASYDAVRNQDSRSQSDDWDLVDDEGIKRRGRQSGKSSALRPAASFASFGSRRSMVDSASHSRTRFPRTNLRGSSPMLIAESGHPAREGGLLGGGIPLAATSEDEDEGDEVISIDEDEDVLDPPDNSPYPQVRASVAATDDLSASINTPRMWSLALSCALLGSATNLFFSLRYPSVAITPVIALVIVHPLGRAWDRLLKLPDDPTETFECGHRVRAVKMHDPVFKRSRTSRLRLWLAQGQWNGKEHACVSKFQERDSLLGGKALVANYEMRAERLFRSNP